MFQSTKPVPGTVYYARPSGSGGAAALFAAPQYSSTSVPTTASASEQFAPASASAPAKSWAMWLLIGGAIAGGAWLMFRD